MGNSYDGWTVYKCPHCPGFVGIHARIPHYDIGIEVQTHHWNKIPEDVKAQTEGLEPKPMTMIA